MRGEPFPKPFRNLRPKPKTRLTTIFAIKCSDGLVMCSDTQATVAGQAKETATKITFVGENAILGCSGNELYIQKLEDAFESFSSDTTGYKQSITECVRSYSKEVSTDMAAAGTRRFADGTVPRLYETDALLAFSDSSFVIHLFQVNAPYGAFEEKKPPFRLSVGSGGFISNFVLKTVEERIFSVVELGWQDMTMKEVMQFSAFLIFVVGQYEANTSPIGRIYYLSKISRLPREAVGVEVFGDVPRNGQYYLTEFLKTVLAHHPEQVKKWIKTYMDDDLLQRLLGLVGSL